MRFAAYLDQHKPPRTSALHVAEALRRQLQSETADLAVLFITPDHASHFEDIVTAFRSELPCRRLLGCTAESVVGRDREVETGPAISGWAAVMPGVEITTFHARFEPTPDGLLTEGLPTADEFETPVRAVLLFGDPYTCPAPLLISRLADDLPNVPLLGGMASAANSPGENRLVRDDEITNFGGVGAVLCGPVRVRTIVSQGCRPVGRPYVVTRAERNVIVELGGRPALERLREVYAELPVEHRELFRRGPHIGMAMNEYKDHFDRGDFLVSNVIDADEDAGAVAVGTLVRTGQTVQFHVRDADTADEDLRAMLTPLSGIQPTPDRGALLFTCNGRGTRMFPEPNHDAAVVQSLAGPLPLAGFFAQGELGPVAGRNHIHGFTASLAVFEPEAETGASASGE
ncbi:MAG: FIST C-terminal domain-containing protein [Planctomyces sp.]|nr:FIST C-terminal domain-containing protein [Planctomyces sp.]